MKYEKPKQQGGAAVVVAVILAAVLGMIILSRFMGGSSRSYSPDASTSRFE